MEWSADDNEWPGIERESRWASLLVLVGEGVRRSSFGEASVNDLCGS
jgi:hypothetical protein